MTEAKRLCDDERAQLTMEAFRAAEAHADDARRLHNECSTLKDRCDALAEASKQKDEEMRLVKGAFEEQLDSTRKLQSELNDSHTKHEQLVSREHKLHHHAHRWACT
jgi:chromosome segregation ATPase